MTRVEIKKAPGMGAIPRAEGTTFRVWAPHASEVYVTGSFNDWSESSHALAQEGNGYWATIVAQAGPGDEYRFIIVNGERFSRIDPYAREVTSSVGNGVILDRGFDWGEDDYELPPWNQVVIYELHVGTFNSGARERPGTFSGVVEKLPYLRDLGINAIEIMPPMEFPGGFSWGYNPSHPFALESDYGGANGFKQLVKAAHAHGIAVILDVVYNHFGPSDLDLWQFDGWSEDDTGGIYFYNDWRAKTPWGDTRPDYSRDEVRQYLRDNVIMWLEEYRIDGLRWDSTAYIRNVEGNDVSPSNDLPDGWSLMQWINEETRARYPNALSVAEEMTNNPWLTKPHAEGGAGFGSQWDPQFVHSIREAIITNDDAFRDMRAVGDALQRRLNDGAFKRVIYTESHDEVANGRARVPEEIWPGNVDSWFSKKRSTLGAALVLTAPGIPMLFQGQEFIEDRWFHERDPLDWASAERFAGIVDLYRMLIRLRRNLDGVSAGLSGEKIDVFHRNDDDKILAMHRWEGAGGPGNSVLVVVNMAVEPREDYRIGLPAAGTWKVRFNSDSRRYDEEFGNHPTLDLTAEEEPYDGLPFSGAISIGPYTATILSQDITSGERSDPV